MTTDTETSASKRDEGLSAKWSRLWAWLTLILVFAFFTSGEVWLFTRTVLCWAHAAELIGGVCRFGWLLPISLAGLSFIALTMMLRNLVLFVRRFYGGALVRPGVRRYFRKDIGRAFSLLKKRSLPYKAAILSSTGVIGALLGCVCYFVLDVPAGLSIGAGSLGTLVSVLLPWLAKKFRDPPVFPPVLVTTGAPMPHASEADRTQGS
jgi:hypothetical protein